MEARNLRIPFDTIPIQKYCRWFVRHGDETFFDRGFKTKEEASQWIDGCKLDWRVGFLFRLRGDTKESKIVNSRGIPAK